MKKTISGSGWTMELHDGSLKLRLSGKQGNAEFVLYGMQYEWDRLSREFADAAAELDREDECPKCGKKVSHKGGHGPWCKNKKCKWGWEIDTVSET